MVKTMATKVLTEVESRNYLQRYNIELNLAVLTKTKADALYEAKNLKFPLVLKIVSPDIIHKSDVGGVITNIQDLSEVSKGYDAIYSNAKNNGVLENKIEGILIQEMIVGQEEMLVGIKRDIQFGPVLVIGFGGVFVELLKDVSLGICPLTRDEILIMLKKLKGFPLLDGYRGNSKLDIEAFVSLCENVMHMALQDERIIELDLNPVMIKIQGEGAVAVDARIVLSLD